MDNYDEISKAFEKKLNILDPFKHHHTHIYTDIIRGLYNI